MANPGVTIVQHFTYRGVSEEYSNQYHFQGSAPSDSAGWIALIGALLTLHQELTPAVVTITKAYGYADTDSDSVFTYLCADHGGDLAGTLTTGGGIHYGPGDTAYWIRWKTGRTNSKGKPIYLRKYFHPAVLLSTSTDQIDTTARTNLQSVATTLLGTSGAWPGLAGPSDDRVDGPAAVSLYSTTRTLNRRGRRPT